MKWLDKILGKDKPLLVHLINLNVVFGKGTYSEKDGVLTFYLYESEMGTRTMEHRCSVVSASNNFDAISDYTEKIYPWLKGMNFDDIPSYWDKCQDNRKKYILRLYNKVLKGR